MRFLTSKMEGIEWLITEVGEETYTFIEGLADDPGTYVVVLFLCPCLPSGPPPWTHSSLRWELTPWCLNLLWLQRLSPRQFSPPMPWLAHPRAQPHWLEGTQNPSIISARDCCYWVELFSSTIMRWSLPQVQEEEEHTPQFVVREWTVACLANRNKLY